MIIVHNKDILALHLNDKARNNICCYEMNLYCSKNGDKKAHHNCSKNEDERN